jgi:hypothetical protein
MQGKKHVIPIAMQITIAIPGPLKQQLISDHDCIKQNKNVPMPRTPCILDILEKYTQHAQEQTKTTTPDVEEQVAHGIRNYFDRTLALVCPESFRDPCSASRALYLVR